MRRDTRIDAGFVTLEHAIATACTLVMLLGAANLAVDLYVRAAVRDALGDAVRTAQPTGRGVTDCARRATSGIDTLVRGPMRRSIVVRCSVQRGFMTADAQGRFVSFLPGVFPAWTFTVRASGLPEGR